MLTKYFDAESGDVVKIAYDTAGKVSKLSFGYVTFKTSGEIEEFTEKTFTSYSYATGYTEVTNEKGIVQAFYYNADGQVTAVFEKSGNDLKTLKKDTGVYCAPSGTVKTGTINGKNIYQISGGALSFSPGAGYDIARSEEEKKYRYFTFCFWLNLYSASERVKVKLNYSVYGAAAVLLTAEEVEKIDAALSQMEMSAVFGGHPSVK